MNIVLVGAGEVGFNLSKVLSKDGHNLTIVDTFELAFATASLNTFKAGLLSCVSGS